MWIRSILSSALVLASTTAALAQTTTNEPPAPEQPCQASPGQQSSEGDQTSSVTPAPSASEKLDACNGVLTPPRTGDKAIAQPAPETGKMPVIKPGQVPQQPPQQ